MEKSAEQLAKEKAASDAAATREKRASRKAAAACLARQRHKSFVHSLQEQGVECRARISLLKRRRGHTVRSRRPPHAPPTPPLAPPL